MVDQERRENIITDIKNIICNTCSSVVFGIEGSNGPCKDGVCKSVISEASTICDYILNKEEETKKETAKRIEIELLKTYRKALLKAKGWEDWFKREFGVVVSDEELFS